MAVRIQELLNGRGAPSGSSRASGAAGSSPRAGAFGIALAKQSQRTGETAVHPADHNKKDTRPSAERSPDKPAKSADDSQASKADASPQEKKTNSAQPGTRGERAKASDSSDSSADISDESTAVTKDAASSDPAVASDVVDADKTQSDSDSEKTDTDKDSKPAASEVTAQPALQDAVVVSLPQPGATPSSATVQPSARPATPAPSGQVNAASPAAPAAPTAPGDVATATPVQAANAQAALPADGGKAVPANLADKTRDAKASAPSTGSDADAIGAPLEDAKKSQAGGEKNGQSPANTTQASQQAAQSLPVDSDAGTNAQSQNHKPNSDGGTPDTAPTVAHELLSAPQAAKPAQAAAPVQLASAQVRSEVHFADTNHPSIVQGITGRLMPTGGTMQLRLNPPELGVMQITVNIKDGLMTASFQTSNDQATQLLSHSLHELRGMLESQGMAVQKLQVQQQPAQNFNSKGQGTNSQSQQQQQAMHDQSGRQEQQRKDLIQRMWAKLGVGSDPLDVTG